MMRLQWHRCLLGASIAVLALWFAAPSWAAIEYDFVYVDAFQGDYDLRECHLFDVNNQGIGCGLATDTPSYSGYFWSVAADKTRLPFTLARGINEAGRIAGLNQVFDISTGALTTIGPVPGAVASPVALDINDHDIVVGYAETCFCSNSNRTLQIPFIWDPVGGSRSIPVSGAKELVKVNNHDVAVGVIRGGSPDGFVYEIATGRVVRMSPFLPTNPYPWTEAADINDAGMVTGRHRSDDAEFFHGFVWTETGGATLLPPLVDRMDVYPWALNDSGIVVGMAEISNHDWRAFMWDAERGIRDLNELVTLPANFILERALGINERGWIFGNGHYGPGWSSSQSFVLIPRAGAVLAAESPTTAGVHLRVWPNPSSGPVTIEYLTETAGLARISVFDLGGRKLATLLEDRTAGAHVARWDGRDAAGRPLPPGAYVVRLELAGRVVTRRLALIR